MEEKRLVALYARVSSQRQADEATIESQVADLEQRIAADGFILEAERRFLDDGCSGSSLRRPALERLRDLAYAGGVERIYIHHPDRLSRHFSHQLLLMEEFSKRRVEVVFLNQPKMENSPESHLLLHMQGMIAEYERAKILERTRRGRRFGARQGRISVLGCAPYGYRYVSKHDGDGEARYDPVLDEARVVREVFHWVGLEGLSLRQAARRLTVQQTPTRRGHAVWNPGSVRNILVNPAYFGEAHWGKSRVEERSPDYRPKRGYPEVPRRDKVPRPTPPSEHEVIRVPALISRDLFDAAAERLEENRRRQRSRRVGPLFLLGGLLTCQQCGSAYCGQRLQRANRMHVYYRCLGTDKHRKGAHWLCRNTALAENVEHDVWNDVCTLLQDPERLQQELQRRQAAPATAADATERHNSIDQLKGQLKRLIDMYETGYLPKDQFDSRAQRVQARLAREEQTHADQRQAEQQARQQQALLTDFEQFARHIHGGLENADFASKRKILELLIKRIEVSADELKIIYKVQTCPFDHRPEGGSLQLRFKCLTFQSALVTFWSDLVRLGPALVRKCWLE
jgi:site-specific DNA recombinase